MVKLPEAQTEQNENDSFVVDEIEKVKKLSPKQGSEELGQLRTDLDNDLEILLNQKQCL